MCIGNCDFVRGNFRSTFALRCEFWFIFGGFEGGGWSIVGCAVRA